MLTGPRLEPEGGAPPSGLVILLHGFAADGRQLVPLARAFRSDLFDLAYLLPHAPFALGGTSLRSWTEPNVLADDSALFEGLAATAPFLERFIDAERARYLLEEDRVALVGFSQGAMLALHVGLRREATPAAIVGFSGELVGRDRLDDITARSPVAMVHGDRDPVIPVASMWASADALQATGVPVTTTVIPGLGHRIDQRASDAGLEALLAAFPDQ